MTEIASNNIFEKETPTYRDPMESGDGRFASIPAGRRQSSKLHSLPISNEEIFFFSIFFVLRPKRRGIPNSMLSLYNLATHDSRNLRPFEFESNGSDAFLVGKETVKWGETRKREEWEFRWREEEVSSFVYRCRWEIGKKRQHEEDAMPRFRCTWSHVSHMREFLRFLPFASKLEPTNRPSFSSRHVEYRVFCGIFNYFDLTITSTSGEIYSMRNITWPGLWGPP